MTRTKTQFLRAYTCELRPSSNCYSIHYKLLLWNTARHDAHKKQLVKLVCGASLGSGVKDECCEDERPGYTVRPCTLRMSSSSMVLSWEDMSDAARKSLYLIVQGNKKKKRSATKTRENEAKGCEESMPASPTQRRRSSRAGGQKEQQQEKAGREGGEKVTRR